jgi:hypothetical protein
MLDDQQQWEDNQDNQHPVKVKVNLLSKDYNNYSKAIALPEV